MVLSVTAVDDWAWFMYFSKNFESSSTTISSLFCLLEMGATTTSLKPLSTSIFTTESLYQIVFYLMRVALSKPSGMKMAYSLAISGLNLSGMR